MTVSMAVRFGRPPGSNVQIGTRLVFRPEGEEDVVEYELTQKHPFRKEVSRFRTDNWYTAREYHEQGWTCRDIKANEFNCCIHLDGLVTYQLSDGRRIEARFDENDYVNVDMITVNGIRNRVVLTREAFEAMQVVMQSLALFEQQTLHELNSTPLQVQLSAADEDARAAANVSA